jgi:hypothetical protein
MLPITQVSPWLANCRQAARTFSISAAISAAARLRLACVQAPAHRSWPVSGHDSFFEQQCRHLGHPKRFRKQRKNRIRLTF